MIQYNIHTVRSIAMLLCIYAFTATSVLAQNDSITYQDTVFYELGDTAYFKAGEDNLNMLNSVIFNDDINVNMLLERGADPNTVSSVGNSALIYAAEKGNMEIMKLLIEKGADVNASGFRQETSLFMSIFNNDFQSTKYLLENGADPNVKDDLGVTPLMYAAATNQYQSADLLLFYDADETVTDKEGNDPMLTSVTFENIETSDVLLQNGLSPDVQDIHGNTPAIVATQRANYSILELLLDYNADVNIANDKNFTPLAYAVTFNDYKTSKLLIDHGADVDHQISSGKNILEIARIAKNDSLQSLLKEKDAKMMNRPHFSDFHLSWGNSFSTKDYQVQFRGSIVDNKYGYFISTGIDYRPILLKVQRTIADTIYQFRERRIGWSHGVGKYFKLHESTSGLTLSAYAALNGYMSFPRYSGSSAESFVEYNIIPAAGAYISWTHVGLKIGAEWYKFGTELESGLKLNMTLVFRIVSPEKNYDRKEINWE